VPSVKYPEQAYWIERGLESIVPAGNDNPEGFDPTEIVEHYALGSILEIGCGFGRIARGLDPKRYLGLDINPKAIELAKVAHPKHTFEVISGDKYPSAETILYYTVMLHMGPDALAHEIEKISAGRYKRVIVCEIMDEKWRREGNPPVFNRSPESYIKGFEVYGWNLLSREDRPYNHYVGQRWDDSRSTEITCLVFDRD